ncbi:unnamed protein product [Rhizophagus irregularis]|uniref:Galactose oxidase n=3 Tax=Rhizophagus irregularis TaxID=588596 RepID=A0A915ZED3_9GLOM|nr:unnamed protein product [Rhizophagus irregularis]CAB5373266.1 unnamed protein product [Rhizophagus irregularis]
MIVIKIIIYFIFFLLNFLNLILGAPILTTNISPRWGHTATLVGTRIYFIGGRTLGNVLATEFLSLDVSKSFTSLQPEWFSFDTVGVPKALGHTAVKGGPNNDQIIIFGGSVDDPVTALTSSLYVYDTVNDEFTNLKLPNGPNRRYDHSAVTSPSGKMLIYGGYVDQWTGSPKALMTSELWELNTINLNTWNGFPSISNSPGLRRSHTASIIENKMYILGGVVSNTPLGMNVIYVFNLLNNVWEVNTATGDVPLPRREFSSVVANEKIIIYGGTDVSRSELYGDVAILDTNTWTWSKQETTNSPPNRSGHTATLVGANMIVAFGSTDSSTIDSSIYILNIINWSWDTQYVPMELPSDDSFTTMKNITNPNINRKNNANNADTTRIYLIVIIVLAVVCGILFIIIIWYVIYKLIDDYKIRAGIHLVGHPYESNPIQSAEPQQPTRPRPAFLCLGRSNKRDKHYSTQSTQSAQGLVNNYSIPTSPSTGPSTPHTMTMNNNRYSNNSGSGTFNRHSFASGVGGAGGIGNIGPFTRFSGVGKVTFSDQPEMFQYSPESEGSNISPFDTFDDDSEPVNKKDRLRVSGNIKPKGSVDDIPYQFGTLYVSNPDQKESEDEEDDDDEEGYEEEEESNEDEEGEDEEEESNEDEEGEDDEEDDEDEGGNNNEDDNNNEEGDDDDDDDEDDNA